MISLTPLFYMALGPGGDGCWLLQPFCVPSMPWKMWLGIYLPVDKSFLFFSWVQAEQQRRCNFCDGAGVLSQPHGEMLVLQKVLCL